MRATRTVIRRSYAIGNPELGSSIRRAYRAFILRHIKDGTMDKVEGV